MKVLVVGSGGREHTLVWKISQSDLVRKIYCAPGNGGIGKLAQLVDIKADDIGALADFAQKEEIDLTVVGPEAPIALGIVDMFKDRGLKIFGPSKAASMLESSKIFAKDIMTKYGIPTADFKVFSNTEKAIDFVKTANRPLVIKADGLCAGKGVFVCLTLEEQQKAIKAILEDKIFGAAGTSIMIEEKLEGQEASIIVVSDGDHTIAMASSQDHKRIFDNDQGPNTGGMGAFSPAPVVNTEIFEQVQKKIIMPTIQGMKEKGIPYTGVLYAGIMITSKGPKVLEFNVRFGDPETQVILPRLESDLVEIMLKTEEKKLNEFILKWDKRACVCVVIASGGYPGKYMKGKTITGLDELDEEKDIIVFHAGTKLENGQLKSSGGRVLGVTGLGDDIQLAIDKTYKALSKVKFDNMFYRNDIGKKALMHI